MIAFWRTYGRVDVISAITFGEIAPASAGVRYGGIDVSTHDVRSVFTVVRSFWTRAIAISTTSVLLFHSWDAAVYAIRFSE
jgi:hypothetical protein